MLSARAATFTVTSNADSGPGTLREALTLAAANGSATQDIIVFNIADLSEAGRTITINTVLPNLSPNLVINGLAQPGNVFGVSAAKIDILATYTSSDPSAIYIFAGDGITNFSMSGLYLSTTNEYSNNLNLISISNSNEINIDHCLLQSGAVFLNTCAKAIFQSNMLGYSPNGITGHPSALTIWDTGEVIIGGNISQGNLLSGFVTLRMFKVDQDWAYLINNNKMGTDYTGISSSTSLYSQARINIESGHYNPPGTGKMHGTIANNLIENFTGTGLVVSGFGDVVIKGNSIGTDNTGTINFSQFLPDYLQNSTGYTATAIALEVGIDATVGGDNPGDANKIAYVSNGILEQLANHVVISKNSIYCLNRNYFNIHDFVTQAYTKPLPVVQINSITNTTITGTATPGARVELFSNNAGTCVACEPKDFFTTVTANAQGNWFYSGVIPLNIVASAIYDNQTSLFTKATIDISDLKLIQPNCGDNTGAIQGVKFYNAGQVRWVNESGTTVSNSPNVNNLPPGKYKLKIGSDICGAETDWIEIIDNSLAIDVSKINIKPASCGSSTGLIWGIKANVPVILTWQGGGLSGTVYGTEVSNVPAGSYTFTYTTLDGSCSKTISPIIVSSTSGPNIDESAKVVNATSCGQIAGSIKNITATGTNVKYSWKNEPGTEVGTSANLDGVPAGKYTLTVTDDSNCGPATSSPIEIPLINDISINTGTKIVQDATCDNFDGSINNITVTGTGTYLWTNEQGTNVGHDLILTGAPSGKYKLTVTSANCPPVSTELIEIKSINGVSLDFSGLNVISATCTSNNGSITGLQTSNVTGIEWRRKADNAFVANTINITGKPAGDYVLTIKNATCSKSYDFNIEQTAPVIFPDFAATYTKSCAAFGTGTITLNTGSGEQPVDFHWVNSNGDRVGYTSKVEFLPAGNYKLYLKDKNGCKNFYKNYIVEAYPEFKVNNFGNITNAQCGVSMGAVSPTLVSGGTGNYTYIWLDADNNIIPGKTQNFIDNMPAGKYTLRITDGGCNLAEPPYEILAVNVDPPTPLVSNIDRCSGGPAVIAVNSAYPTAKYRLYETSTSPQPIDEQEGGKFNINVTESRNYYVSLTYGNCESLRAEVKVMLGSITGGIANTFTPNGDGINDFWKIKGIENYTNGTVSIFTRNGKQVYKSKGYAVPFDGTYNGKPLAAGVYYYVIDLKSCSLISGYVTILR